MAKYRVYLQAVVSTVVEAEDGDSAVDAALEVELPYLNISNRGMDMGDWTTASELWKTSPSDDYELIEE